MLALPEHTRSTYNLYLAGPRMRKIARYADQIYDKMTDAGEIIQIQGPRMSDSMGLWKGKLPKGAELIERIDEFPEDPKEWANWHKENEFRVEDWQKIDETQRRKINPKSETDPANITELPTHPFFPDHESSEIKKI